jgi:hypothetical protein
MMGRKEFSGKTRGETAHNTEGGIDSILTSHQVIQKTAVERQPDPRILTTL